ELMGLSPCYELTACSGNFGAGPVCNRPGSEPGVLECDTPDADEYDCGGLYTTANSVYECEGYRLPTEAEWEYAARAGRKTAFWTGDITPLSPDADCPCDGTLQGAEWYCFNSGKHQHAVGELKPNWWGL